MLKTIDVRNLYESDFSVRIINSMRQFWTTTKSFSCLGTPKNVNMLLFLDGFSAKYTFKNGKEYFAKSGDIVYTSVNSEYRVDFSKPTGETPSTVGINFYMFDCEFSPLVIGGEIHIFTAKDIKIKLLVDKLDESGKEAVSSPARLKSLFFEILARECFEYRYSKLIHDKFDIISDGIMYMEKDTEQKKSIKEIASMCNVSEIYFRKLFKQYTNGVSPIEFRLNAKLTKAKALLRYENLTVKEIADCLGFSDPAYFAKLFKRKTGLTPVEYKRCK